MHIPVCFSCDNKYSPYLGVAITAVLKNKNKDDNLVFYILDGGISKEDKGKLLSLKSIADFEIKFIKVDNTKFHAIRVYRKDHITYASYYRLILPDLCNNEGKIIYLDCDLVVRASLRKMLEIDLTGYYIGGVLDSNHIEQEKRLGLKQYINAGILLINAQTWRRNNITEKIFNWAKNNKDIILYHDQDIINGFFKQKIKVIDSDWNWQIPKIDKQNSTFSKTFADAKIVHYVVYKPWKGPLCYIPMQNLYFKYLALTPWKNLKYKFKVQHMYSDFKIFMKWLFAVRNISRQYKGFYFFGKPIIKFVRKETSK